MDTDEITELDELGAEKVSGVGSPANGTPWLMLKSTDVRADPESPHTESAEADAQEDAMTKAEADEIEAMLTKAIGMGYCWGTDCEVCKERLGAIYDFLQKRSSRRQTARRSPRATSPSPRRPRPRLVPHQRRVPCPQRPVPCLWQARRGASAGRGPPQVPEHWQMRRWRSPPASPTSPSRRPRRRATLSPVSRALPARSPAGPSPFPSRAWAAKAPTSSPTRPRSPTTRLTWARRRGRSRSWRSRTG